MNRSTAITVVFALILAAGAIVVAREFRGALARPAVQRLEHRRTLQTLAEALRAYRADSGDAWPDTLFQLFRHEHLALGANRGYVYRKPAAGAPPDAIVVSSEAYHPAVKAGEPYGAEGERADHDIPAVAYVVTADLTVRELPLDEATRRSPTPPTIPVR